MKKYLLFIFTVCLLLIQCLSANNKAESNRIRVLIDSDANNELDDQHAIAYTLFNSHIFDVEGITVNETFNGGGIEGHYEEAERVVKLCGMDEKISIYKGASGNYADIVDHINEPDFDGNEAVDFIIDRANAQSDRKLVLLPIGKLTNIALALKKDPSIVPKVRIVWLGANYPEYGEYNFVNDNTAYQPIIDSGADFEIVTVRYGKPSGTDAVKAYLKDIRRIMPGKGPHISKKVIGRHGGSFDNFGDYSVSLFVNYREENSSRPLFDMAAVAIVKNPEWAEKVVIPAPKFENKKWIDQPENPNKIIIWENFDKRQQFMYFDNIDQKAQSCWTKGIQNGSQSQK